MNNVNYLHCVQDSIFAKCVVSEFECIKDRINSFYVICTFEKNKNYKYINEVKDKINVVSPINLNKFILKNNINVVVLHNILSLHYINILSLPSNVKIVWFAWGKDIYELPKDRPFINLELYLPITKKALPNYFHKSFYERIKDSLQNFFLKKVVSKVDFFSGVLTNEYKMISSYPMFRAEEVVFHYTDLKEAPTTLLNSFEMNNILIGNSGDPSNNHLDIMEKLSKYNLGKRCVYATLSYGGNNEYIQKVITKGKELWGERFKPLLEYMPINDYKEILSSCGIRIFGHERQQAIGNIGIGLKSGCKIFLSQTSVAYEYYKSIGIQIYTIQNDLNEKELNKQLVTSEVERNIEIMNQFRSSDVFYKDLIKTVETINSSL